MRPANGFQCISGRCEAADDRRIAQQVITCSRPFSNVSFLLTRLTKLHDRAAWCVHLPQDSSNLDPWLKTSAGAYRRRAPAGN